MTKLQMRLQMCEELEQFNEEKWNHRLGELEKQKRITWGCYLVNALSDNYYWNKFLELNNDNTKREHTYIINELKKVLENLKQFIKEQENLPFEQTQMQLAIANGTIRYM